MGNIDDGLNWYNRKRYIICIILFFGYVHVYLLRVNISIAIVSMTLKKSEGINAGLGIQKMYFDWDSTQKGNILSSFFYGYIFTQLAGGILAAQFGAKYVMAAGVGVPGLITILTPWLTQLPVEVFITSRFCVGFFSGVTFPCNPGLWSRWAPPQERSRLISFAYTGMYFGSAIILLLGGVIAHTIGWPWIFILTGVSAVTWAIIWLVVVQSDPESDHSIDPKELEYIQNQVGPIQLIKINKHPWKSIILSLPVWSNVITLTVMNWVLYTFLTQMPTYLNGVYGFPITSTGFASAIPYVFQTIFIITGAQVADCVITRKIFRVVTVRKFLVIFSCAGQLVACILIVLIFNAYAAVAFLTMMFAFNALSWPGFSVNWLDLAPPHASVLMGFANTFGTLGGIISPILSGYLTPNQTGEEWNIVFYIIGGLLIINAIFYGIFASADLQPWVTNFEDEKI